MENICNIQNTAGFHQGGSALIMAIYKKLSGVKLPKLYIENEQVSPEIYAYIYYQALMSMQKNILIYATYKCVNKNPNYLCTGTTELFCYGNDPREYYTSTQKYGKQLLYKKYPGIPSESYTYIATELYSRAKQCKYSTLLLGVYDTLTTGETYGHQNVIFTRYKASDRSLHLVLYEPHGLIPALDEAKHYKKVELFLAEIQAILTKKNVKVKIHPRYIVSCPYGIQQQAGDRVGFCVLYSIFMVYCVLWKIQSGGEHQSLRKLLDSTESDIIKIFGKNMNDFLIIFMIMLSNLVIHYIPKNRQEKWHKILYYYKSLSKKKLKM